MMGTNRNQTIYEALMKLGKEKIAAHVADGGKILFRSWGEFHYMEDTLKLRNKCGCALAIMAVGAKRDPFLDDILKIKKGIQEFSGVNLLSFEIEDFTNRFDTNLREDYPSGASRAGRELRLWVLETFPNNCKGQ